MPITQAVILSLVAVVSAVLLDLYLLRWARQRIERKGKPTEYAVHVFGVYSPVLTWLKAHALRRTKDQPTAPVESTPSPTLSNTPMETGEAKSIGEEDSLKETETLKQRILELEGQVKELEQEISLSRVSTRTPVDLRSKAKPILYLFAVIFFAAIPSILVFRHRWLAVTNIITPFNELWNQIWPERNPGLPAYFATVVLSVIALLLLIFFSRQESPIERKKLASVSMDERGLSTRVVLNQIRFSQGCLVSAFLISGATFVYGLVSKRILGWGFFIGFLLYILGWCLREISFDEVKKLLLRNWEIITAFLLFHFSLIMLLGNYASQWEFDWAFMLLLILSLINLFRYYRRIPAIIWVISLAIILFSININSWEFSVIGDEYSFYERAEDIAERSSIALTMSNFFNGQWVYGSHPFFSSFLQGVSMSLFGSNSFGWRFSSVYLSALSIGFLFLVYKTFLPRRTAFVAALFLAFSSYLMSFGKVGYNNLQALFALSVTMWAATWAVQSRRPLAFAALGLSLGLCFYVYPAALNITPIPFLLLLLYYPPTSRESLRGWGMLLVSALFLLLPLFLQPGYWQSKIPGLWLYNPEISSNASETIYHVISNFLLALFSFLYIVDESHFIAVAYADPLTAMLVLIGLALVLKQVRRERFTAYLLVSFILMLLFIGVSHDRRSPPNTRMFLLLPWFTVFASIGLLWVIDRVKALQIVTVSQTSLISLVMIGVLGFNLYQAYPLSKQRSIGHQTLEVLFARLVQERLKDFEPSTLYPKTFLFITDESWGIDGFHMLERAYSYPASRIYLQRLMLENPELPDSAIEMIENRNTLVIIQPTMNHDWQELISSSLHSLGKLPCEVKEYSNKDTRFVMWYSLEVRPLCPSRP